MIPAFILSCSKDDEPDKTQTLFNITVSDDYEPREGDFFFITTIDGEFIDMAEILGPSATLAASAELDEEIVLHRFLKTGTGGYTLISRVGVPPRDLFLSGSTWTPAGSFLGNAFVRFTDIPANDGHFVSPSDGALETLTQSETYRATVYEDQNESYLLLRNGESASYKFLDNLVAGIENFFSLAQMNDDMTKHTLNMNGLQTDFSYISVRKSESQLNGLRMFDSRRYPDKDPSGNYEFFIPQDLGDYSTFYSYLTGIYDSNDAIEYRMIVRGSVPDRFEVIDADISSVSADVNNFRMEVNGNYDYSLRTVIGTTNEDDFINMQWLVYSAEERNVRFPTLPPEIQSRYPEFSAQGIEDQKQVTYSFSVHELSYLDGYDELIGRIYPENFVPPPAIRTHLIIDYYVTVNKPGRSVKAGQIEKSERDHFRDLY